MLAKISKNDRPVAIEYQINVCSWEIELDMDLSFLPLGGGFTTGKYTFPSARAAKVRSCPPPPPRILCLLRSSAGLFCCSVLIDKITTIQAGISQVKP